MGMQTANVPRVHCAVPLARALITNVGITEFDQVFDRVFVVFEAEVLVGRVVVAAGVGGADAENRQVWPRVAKHGGGTGAKLSQFDHHGLSVNVFGRFDGADVYTTAESERLVRLPMYYGLTEDDQNKVIAKVLEFYEK